MSKQHITLNGSSASASAFRLDYRSLLFFLGLVEAVDLIQCNYDTDKSHVGADIDFTTCRADSMSTSVMEGRAELSHLYSSG